jgi:hypothetical protein
VSALEPACVLIVRQVCQTADDWLWVNRTASDPRFYIEGGTTLASSLSAVRVESVSPGLFGTLKIETPSEYSYKDVIVVVRAGHHSLDVLRRIAICRRVFANATALVSVEVSVCILRRAALTRVQLLEPLPEGRVSLEMSIQLPSAMSSESGPRLAPNLTVEVASMNVSCLGNIARSTYFNSLSLATTNGSISMVVRSRPAAAAEQATEHLPARQSRPHRAERRRASAHRRPARRRLRLTRQHRRPDRCQHQLPA